MDALSDVLSVIRLTGAVFLDMDLRAQWSYITAPARKIADVLMPDADHVIPFHLLAEGACYARLIDGDPVKLEAGDLILFPHGDRHLLIAGDAGGLRLEPTDITGDSLRQLLKRGDIAAFKHAGAGDATRIVCGFVACDKRLAQPILTSLPRLLHVRIRDGSTAAMIRSAIRHSVAQTGSTRLGSAVVLARLSEVLFAEAVSDFMEQPAAQKSGWLAALRDRHVGLALTALHERPAHPWTVEELARIAGLSRSALGERFNTLIGMPPMQYLTRWRTALAAARLREGDAPVVRIAADVGYESEAAFSRAFKREFGSPPAAWRKQAARSRK